jgi:hypothetical protein
MKVMPADAPERSDLEGQGWAVVARSFGAQLDAHAVDQPRLQGLVARTADVGSVRELSQADVDAVLALDALTIGDYPGSIATQHTPLDQQTATPSGSRRAFGVVLGSGELVAMTFVDVDGSDAETDFTVVHPAWRGRVSESPPRRRPCWRCSPTGSRGSGPEAHPTTPRSWQPTTWSATSATRSG